MINCQQGILILSVPIFFLKRFYHKFQNIIIYVSGQCQWRFYFNIVEGTQICSGLDFRFFIASFLGVSGVGGRAGPGGGRRAGLAVQAVQELF